MKIIKKENPTASLTYTPFENIDKLINQPKKDKKEDMKNGRDGDRNTD